MGFRTVTVVIAAAALAARAPLGAQTVDPGPAHASPAQGIPYGGPGLGSILAGTVIGGTLGAAAGAGLGWVVFSGVERDGGFVDPRAILTGMSAFPGWAVGAGLGAAMAGSTPGARVGRSRPILFSFLGTAVGVGLWVGIGDGFDDEAADDDTPWVVGAVVGGAAHLTLISVTTYRAAREGWYTARETPGGLQLSLSPLVTGGGGVGATIGIVW